MFLVRENFSEYEEILAIVFFRVFCTHVQSEY